jgi:L-lactate dehydrogenase complex protein LldG
MTSSRDAFLQRVREAVAAGNRPASAASFAERGSTGYQGAGTGPVAGFCEKFEAAGGHPQTVSSPAAATNAIIELVQRRGARRALLGEGPVLEELGIAERLTTTGVEVDRVGLIDPESCREACFRGDIGISGVDWLIAETGTIVIGAAVREPRSLSLLPPVHVAVATRSQIVADLFDLFDALSSKSHGNGMTSCVTLITGPSKTGDIELQLVTGVHGPGEVHVVLIDS